MIDQKQQYENWTFPSSRPRAQNKKKNVLSAHCSAALSPPRLRGGPNGGWKKSKLENFDV